MKISKYITIHKGVALLVLVTSIGFAFVNKSKVDNPKITHVDIKNQEGNISYETHLDFPVYDNLKDLYANADCVVRGTVNMKSSKTRNLAKNWRNKNEDAEDMTITIQEYSFSVSDWIKVIVEKNIDIVYGDYTSYKSDNKKFSHSNAELQKNNEYVLFLKKEAKNGTYYLVEEHWKFLIQNDKKVKFMTSIHDIKFDLYNIKLDDFIYKLKY